MRRLHNKVIWRYAITFTVIVFILLTLTACKKEEEQSSSSTLSNSSRLTDNLAPAGASFTNFKSETFSIDPSQLSISGTRVFLKLTRPGGDVLFLGEIDRYQYFSINIDMLLDDGEIFYEIFTNDPGDETNYGTIAL